MATLLMAQNSFCGDLVVPSELQHLGLFDICSIDFEMEMIDFNYFSKVFNPLNG